MAVQNLDMRAMENALRAMENALRAMENAYPFQKQPLQPPFSPRCGIQIPASPRVESSDGRHPEQVSIFHSFGLP